MRQQLKFSDKTDSKGNPAGGQTTGIGIKIDWQDGPIPRDSVNGLPMQQQNGAMVEDVIEAVISRLEFYQKSKFKNSFNSAAIDLLRSANNMLDKRTVDRENRKVEGKNEL